MSLLAARAHHLPPLPSPFPAVFAHLNRHDPNPFQPGSVHVA